MLSLNAEFLHHHGNDVGSDTARNYLTKTYAFISIILYSLHEMEVHSWETFPYELNLFNLFHISIKLILHSQRVPLELSKMLFCPMYQRNQGLSKELQCNVVVPEQPHSNCNEHFCFPQKSSWFSFEWPRQLPQKRICRARSEMNFPDVFVVSTTSIKQEGPAIRGKSWMMEYTRRPEAKPFRVPCLAGSKLDRPARLSCCWRLQKNCSQPTKIARRKNCSRNLLTENHELPFSLFAI